LLNLPQKRLIVFAALAGHKVRLEALRQCQVEAVMYSYLKARESKREDQVVRAFIQTWPTLKILDSGVFTFLRATGTLRSRQKAKENSKPQEVTEAGFKVYADDYMSYLKVNLKDWDFVVELDVDNIFGVEVSRSYRQQLKEIAGDKLIPVWHSVAGRSGWADCYAEFPYIGTGSDKPMDTTFYRHLVNEAHGQGAKVHGFGGTRVDIMQQVPYDTADSTTWLSSVKFGQFGGVNYRRSDMDRRTVARGRQFSTLLEQAGYSAEELLEVGSQQASKYIIAIKLLQLRQRQLPPVPPPKTLSSLLG